MTIYGPQADDFEDDLAGLEPIELTRPQRDCVEYRPEGPLSINGVAGSGKTTVLIARAAWLMSKGEKKILLLTFNKALARYMRALALKAGANQARATHFHEWGAGLLRNMGMANLNAWAADDRWKIVQHAKNSVRYGNHDLDLPDFHKSNKWEAERALVKFLSDEISWIKGQALITEEEYLKAERIGRGAVPRLTSTNRKAVYQIMCRYDELLGTKYYKEDYANVALFLLRRLDKVPLDQRPDHILVDEAQDLTAAQFRVLQGLRPKSITIAADKGQKIYQHPFTWKSVGIDIRGGRSKILPASFRSTQQIVRLARSLQRKDEVLMKDDEYMEQQEPTRQGPMPELYISKNEDAELALVANLARSLRTNASTKAHTIGVIVNANERLDDLAKHLDAARIPYVKVSEEGADVLSPGVKLVTYHSAKGLEFDHVILTGLSQNHMPWKPSPGADEKEFLSAERRRFYVGMTRARLTLTLSAVAPVSEFVTELDQRLYVRK